MFMCVMCLSFRRESARRQPSTRLKTAHSNNPATKDRRGKWDTRQLKSLLKDRAGLMTLT